MYRAPPPLLQIHFSHFDGREGIKIFLVLNHFARRHCLASKRCLQVEFGLAAASVKSLAGILVIQGQGEAFVPLSRL